MTTTTNIINSAMAASCVVLHAVLLACSTLAATGINVAPSTIDFSGLDSQRMVEENNNNYAYFFYDVENLNLVCFGKWDIASDIGKKFKGNSGDREYAKINLSIHHHTKSIVCKIDDYKVYNIIFLFDPFQKENENAHIKIYDGKNETNVGIPLNWTISYEGEAPITHYNNYKYQFFDGQKPNFVCMNVIDNNTDMRKLIMKSHVNFHETYSTYNYKNILRTWDDMSTITCNITIGQYRFYIQHTLVWDPNDVRNLEVLSVKGFATNRWKLFNRTENLENYIYYFFYYYNDNENIELVCQLFTKNQIQKGEIRWDKNNTKQIGETAETKLPITWNPSMKIKNLTCSYTPKDWENPKIVINTQLLHLHRNELDPKSKPKPFQQQPDDGKINSTIDQPVVEKSDDGKINTSVVEKRDDGKINTSVVEKPESGKINTSVVEKPADEKGNGWKPTEPKAKVPSQSKEYITDNKSSKSDTDQKLITGVAAALVLIVLIVLIIVIHRYCKHVKARQRQENSEYENLNPNIDNLNQFPPNLESIYALPLVNSTDNNTKENYNQQSNIVEPIVIGDFDKLYSKPTPKKQRNKPVDIIPNSQKQTSESPYAEIEPTGPQIEYATVECVTKSGDSHTLDSKPVYSEVMKSPSKEYQNVNVKNNGYSNVTGENIKYANTEYVEPAYCELMKKIK